jgi:hypothetical protein
MPVDLALSCIVPAALVAVLPWAIARRYPDESILARK